VNLSEAQVKQGYEVHVIARRGKGEMPEEECKGVMVHRLDPPFNLKAAGLLRKLVRSDDGWVVHTHSTCGFFLAMSKRLRSFPVVCHVHGTSRSHHVPIRYKGGGVIYDYKPISVTYNMMRERILWASGDRVLTVSQAIKEDIVDYYRLREGQVDVVYNGVDTSVFARNAAKEMPEEVAGFAGKSVILFVGHFGLRKGLAYLLAAMPMILKEVPDAHLVCIGGVPRWLGNEDYWGLLRSQIRKLQIDDKVTLLDAVPNAKLPAYYLGAKVLALPSYYESFSKVTVEAMSCELPVVATRAGGLMEVVQDGRTGILVGYGDSAELSDAIVRILKDPRKASEMGRLGRARVEEMFTWEAVAGRVKSVYDSLPTHGHS
jgi:glycosyltransferase involved in cell wall biosynthesis